MFQKFISQQLANPSGLFGRLFTTRWLENANAGMNMLTINSLDLQSSDCLLEIGFGSGYLIEKVLRDQLCQKVFGVDVSPEMVKYALNRFKFYIRSGRADIRYADVESLVFADHSFDKLCSVNTLYFWTKPDIALKECHRVLRRGGYIILCFNSKEDLVKWPGHIHGFSLFDIEEVEQLLRDAGFSEIQIQSENDPKQGLYYCVRGVAL